jgi:hypothetical protein
MDGGPIGARGYVRFHSARAPKSERIIDFGPMCSLARSGLRSVPWVFLTLVVGFPVSAGTVLSFNRSPVPPLRDFWTDWQQILLAP